MSDMLVQDLLLTLYDRENCPNCGGRGIEYVATGEAGDEDVTAETCSCSNAAVELLAQHKEQLTKLLEARDRARDEYVRKVFWMRKSETGRGGNE